MGKYVIAQPAVSELVVEKSRFICTLARVETEAEAQAFVKAMKKKYWDARHNCSAYIVGADNRVERSNDDGEPSGTAGSPMLEVLRRKELYNTAAMVTRYFGGIKLGAGGLTRAYRKTATVALQAAGIATWMRHRALEVTVDYSLSGVFNRNLEAQDWILAGTRYDQAVHYDLFVPEADCTACQAALLDWSSGRAVLDWGDVSYQPR